MIEWPTFIASIGASVGAAAWLARALVTHRLRKDLEDHKAEWRRAIELERQELAAVVKERVENALADRQADRAYELEARRRLYRLIGPPKFQLLIACRDVARRVEEHARGIEYSTQTDGYYGKSLLYRILRPLALLELIESQIAFADFSVDREAIELLILKRSAYRTFTGAGVIANHPDADWVTPTQHVPYELLSQAAHSVLVGGEGELRRMFTFGEFEKYLDDEPLNSGLACFVNILDDFTIAKKPLFWQRLAAYAYVCREHLGSHGTQLRFAYEPMPVGKLVRKTKDAYINKNVDKFERAVFRAVLLTM